MIRLIPFETLFGAFLATDSDTGHTAANAAIVATAAAIVDYVDH